MSPAMLVDVIIDMAWVVYRARAAGSGDVSVLLQVVDEIDDDYLATSIRVVADQEQQQQDFVSALEERAREESAAASRRYRLRHRRPYRDFQWQSRH